MPLLDVNDLRVAYRDRRGRRRTAVDGVSFTIEGAETLGLVGESGSGKSTIGNAILGVTRPAGGRILFRGADITTAGRRARRALAEHIQVVFQDPYGSLNPSRRVGQILAEPCLAGQTLSPQEIRRRVAERLADVGLDAAVAGRFPAQFSGGQRQRIAIARALMLRPKLVVCDEPVSALDLSVQAQVLNLLKDIQARFDTSYLFISHDIAVVAYMAHRIAVIRQGTLVETGDRQAVISSPRHPYTVRLLASALPVTAPSGTGNGMPASGTDP